MKPKKSLGQNFLKDQEALRKIIEAADLRPDENVIEIGPGMGALSDKLINKAGKLIMIEKDNALSQNLASNFQFSIFLPAGRHGNFQSISNDLILNFKNKGIVINADILELNLPELIEKNNFQNYKVVANIPYYITSPIIKLFLETQYPPSEMILMVQREVAERICAFPGEMSILSLSVQYYAKPKLLFYVPKKSFWPVPEVDSALIRIVPHNLTPSPSPSKGEGSSAFFRVVKAGFSSKRKTLLNNLSNGFHISKKEAEEKIKKAGINPAQRAQELSVEDWKKITAIFI